MPSRTIVPAILALVVVAGFVYTRVKRGRRLLALRNRRGVLRLVLNVVFLVVPGLSLVASAQRAKGPWDSISSLSIILLSLSDMGFDLYGRPQPGQFAFHENGLLTHDGRRLVFSKWDEIERYEWRATHWCSISPPRALRTWEVSWPSMSRPSAAATSWRSSRPACAAERRWPSSSPW
jgi:hypothetical protein